MKFTAREVAILKKVLQKILGDGLGQKKRKIAHKKVNKTKTAIKERKRRSGEEKEKLRTAILAARKKKVSVADIAKKNKVTTAYVYHLLGGKSH